MCILEAVAISIPCSACGGQYGMTRKQAALSQEMMHEGCPVRVKVNARLALTPAWWIRK